MKRILTCFLLFQTAAGPVMAQLLHAPVAAPYPASTAYNTLHADAFSVSTNPALLSEVHQLSYGVYGEKRFLINDLSLLQSRLAFPVPDGAFGASMDLFGNVAYQDYKLGLAYGRKLSEKAGAGIRLNYAGYNIPGYGSAASVTIELGALVHLSKNCTAGIHIDNPFKAPVSKESDPLPFIYSAGVGYNVSPQVFLGAEIEKIETRPIGLLASVHYQFNERLSTTVGMNSSNTATYIGFGYLFPTFRLEAIASSQPHLPLTPGLLIIYNPVSKS